MKLVLSIIFIFLTSQILAEGIANHLQDISVMVSAGGGSGSGVIITRSIRKNETSKEEESVNFVVTAAHVVESLRSVRTVIDSAKGTDKKLIEFKPVFVIKDLVEHGRKVGEAKFEGKVLKYSDSENGEDLALLMLYKRDFVKENTKFYLKGDKIVDIGTKIYHMGSRNGQIGAGSLTDGIISKIGQVVTLNNRPILFDLVTCPISPGSSGGGIFIADGEHKGELCGIVVRGGDSTFGLVVPARRIHDWSVNSKLEWVLDEKLLPPSLEEINKIPVE